MNIVKGMNVRVISGNHKGKEGKVLYVIPKKDRIIIEGINILKKHTRPTQENPKGGVVEKEGSIHVSNVAIVNPATGKADRVGFRFEDEKKVRFFKSNGELV